MGVGGPIGVGSSSAAPTGVEERPAEVAGGGGGAAGGGRRRRMQRRRARAGRRERQTREAEMRAAAGVCSARGREDAGERD